MPRVGPGEFLGKLRKAHTRWAPTNYRLGYDFNHRGGVVTTVTPVTQFINKALSPCPFIYNNGFSEAKTLAGCGSFQSNSGTGPGIGDTLDTTLLQSLPASFDAKLYLGSISGAFGGWKCWLVRGRFFQKCVWKTQFMIILCICIFIYIIYIDLII